MIEELKAALQGISILVIEGRLEQSGQLLYGSAKINMARNFFREHQSLSD